MKLAVLVNDVSNLIVHQTTSHLLAAAVRRGHEVYALSVTSLGLSAESVLEANAYLVPTSGECVAELVACLHKTEPVLLSLESCDVLLIRTNPACDQPRALAHQTALTVGKLLQDKGVLVLNDPRGLALASNKLYLSYLPPAYRPRTLVSRNRQELRSFIESVDNICVLKPLQGTWGKDVFFLRPGEGINFHSVIDVLTQDGFAMAQEFIPEATQGDKRVVVMDGKLLEHEGKAAAVGRIPGIGELRSNIHAGGRAEWPVLSDQIRQAVEMIGPRLVKDGIFLAGLDFVGHKLVEVNVFGIGGLQDIERFAGVSFTSLIIQALEQKKLEQVM